METTNKYFLSKVLNLETKKSEKILCVFKDYNDSLKKIWCNVDFYVFDKELKKFVKDDFRMYSLLDLNDKNDLLEQVLKFYEYYGKDIESLSFVEVTQEYYIDNM